MKGRDTFLEMLERWLTSYLPDEEGKRANTIKSYRDTWRLLMFFLYDVKNIDSDKVGFSTLTYETLAQFLKWVEGDRKCSISTRNSRLAAITKFSKYAQNRDFDAAVCFRQACARLPYKKAVDAKERAYFTQEEVAVLLALPEPKDKMGYRDHVLLSTMYASGMRADETCSVTVGDISFLNDGTSSLLIHGKGGKARRIRLSEKPSGMLKKYLAYRRISNQHDRHIFSTQRNERISISCIEEIFAKYVKRARAEHPDLFREPTYTPHSMRHTTAVHMLEAGVPLPVIKQFLGHSNLSTTEIYAKMSQSTVNERLKDWDRSYWHEQCLDASLPESSNDRNSNIPDFLK